MPAQVANRDLRLGRFYMVSLEDQVAEAVGDALESDEAGVAIARRRPRQFTFNFPIRGANQDASPYASGERMRRQIRAMMENTTLRLQSLYIAFAPDPDLNGWVTLGSGLLKYDQNGLTFNMFEMELDSAYRVGSLRVNLPARRVEVYDRRLGVYPRDTRGNIVTADFAGITPLALTPLPVNASNPVGYNWQPVVAYARTGMDGTGYVLQGLQHGQVIAYEQEEADHNKGDVVIYDRQGLAAGEVESNLLGNPSFEYDALETAPAWWTKYELASPVISRWGVGNGWSGGGLQAMRVTASLPAGARLGIGSPLIPIKGGVGHLSVKMNLLALNGCVLRCEVTFFAANGVQLEGGYLPVATLGRMTPEVVVKSSDSRAAFAVVNIFFVNETGTTHEVDGWLDELCLSTVFLPFYRDGDSAGWVWQGTPGNSKSTIDLPGVDGFLPEEGVGTNLCPNGGFERDAVGAVPVGWLKVSTGGAVPGHSGGTISGENGGWIGAHCAKVVMTGEQGTYIRLPAMVAGRAYTATMRLKGAVGGEHVKVRLGDTVGATSSVTEAVLTTTGWVEVSVSYKPSVNIASPALALESTASSTVLMDAVKVSRVSTMTGYRDGDSAGWVWQGTPGNSKSTIDPQSFGWEEVYGRDQRLTAGDVVVLNNQLCRVRFIAATCSYAIDNVENGSWVEQGRVTVWDSPSLDIYTQHFLPIARAGGALSTVEEWTPERALIKVSTNRSASDKTARIDTYISLQRGWLGPRFESYCMIQGNTTPGCQVRWTPNTTANMLEANISPTGTTVFSGDDPLFPWANSPGPTYGTVGEPWVNIVPAAGGQMTTLASIMALARGPNYVDSAAYGGPNRQSAAVAARFNETQVVGQLVYGYVSMHVGFTGAKQSKATFEAESYMIAAGTRTNVEDAAASASHAINDTQSVVLQSPVQSALATATSGGELAAATYYYKIVAVNTGGISLPSNEQSIVTTGATSKNTVKWSAVTGATGYRIYRGTATNSENVFYVVNAVTEFVDTGSASGFPALAVTDNFNRANEYPLSNGGKWEKLPWTTDAGEVWSEQFDAHAASPSTSGSFWNGLFPEVANPAASLRLATLPEANRTVALWAAMKLNQSGYRVKLYTKLGGGGTIYYLERVTEGVATVLYETFGHEPTLVFEKGDSIGISVSGGVVRAWAKKGGVWSLVAEVIDSTYTTGYGAIEAKGPAGLYDDFSYGAAGGIRQSGMPPTEPTGETAPSSTLKVSAAELASVPVGRYGIWVRVRCTTAGDNMKVIAGFGENQTAAKKTGSTTYTWLYLGESARESPAQEFTAAAYQSGGAGLTGVRIDRLVLLATEYRREANPTFDGGRDLAVQHLYDSQAVPELVER